MMINACVINTILLFCMGESKALPVLYYTYTTFFQWNSSSRSKLGSCSGAWEWDGRGGGMGSGEM